MTIEPTDETIELHGGGFARLWQGETDKGVRVVAIVTLVAQREDDDEADYVAPAMPRLAKVIPIRRAAR